MLILTINGQTQIKTQMQNLTGTTTTHTHSISHKHPLTHRKQTENLLFFLYLINDTHISTVEDSKA